MPKFIFVFIFKRAVWEEIFKDIYFPQKTVLAIEEAVQKEILL